jgi:hypothetical protein
MDFKPLPNIRPPPPLSLSLSHHPPLDEKTVLLGDPRVANFVFFLFLFLKKYFFIQSIYRRRPASCFP